MVVDIRFQVSSISLDSMASFHIYTGGPKAPPPQPLCCPPPPLKGFGLLVKVLFCLKMSENCAEIAGNQV